jgi:hypothetical protein
MSNRNSDSMFASSRASDESCIRKLPIVSLLDDVDAYASSVFDVVAMTIKDLQTMEQSKSRRDQLAGQRKLREREELLTGFLDRIGNFQEELDGMRGADFAALSLVWGSGAGRSLSNHFQLTAC